jgi:hypothetical protein
VDSWTDLPGARVEGHCAVVRGTAGASFATCDCGYRSRSGPSVEVSCELLVSHLQAEVRAGARVLFDDGGQAGVREPRVPVRPLGSLDVRLDVRPRSA